MDKISGFPDEILVKILSFLPTKAAVSTSILSKRWKFLWMWLPKLDYLDDYHESLVDFINKNLPLHRAPVIESLRLEPSSRHTKPEDFKLWIEIAVSRYVRELEVSFNSGHSINIFPSCLFSCKSLVILKLEYVDLVDVPSMVCLPSLKSLLLNEVYTDGKTLQQLLFICPVLDDLDLTLFEYSEKMEEFTVSVPSLQKLSLSVPIRSVSDGYEIDSPSLKYLKLKGRNHVEHYSLFKHMPKLTEAYINVESGVLTILVGAITSVKHLTLCGEDVYGDGFVFNQLEHLKLCVCHKDSSNLLAQLLKDSPNLQVLDIYMLQGHGWAGHNSMVCWNQPIHVPECMLSSLQIFKWSRYFGRPQDRDIAVYILKNARHLKTATILADTTKQNVSNLKMIKELTLSSRASTKCELVFVDDRSDDSSDDSSDDNRT